jgi:hypothetical protein
LGDFAGAKKHAVLAVEAARPDGDTLATEGLRNLPQAAFEAHISLGSADRAHDFMLVIFDPRKTRRHRARARYIAAGRHFLIERLVRPFEIVDGAPLIESTLDLAEIAEAPQGKYLGLEGAVEALVLAAGLGMGWRCRTV